MDPLFIIIQNIKLLIKEKDYVSVEKFCLENSIPKSTLSELLNRKKQNPKLSTLVKIANSLEIDVIELFKKRGD